MKEGLPWGRPWWLKLLWKQFKVPKKKKCDPAWTRTRDPLLSLPTTAFAAPEQYPEFVVWTMSSPSQVQCV
jgi:hypothetical protein